MTEVRAPEPYADAPPFPWRRVGGVVAALAAVAAAIVGVAFGLVRETKCGFTPDEDAVFLLRAVAAAQERFRTARVVDEDADGVGEFGGLAELEGLVPPRGGPGASVPRTLGLGAFVAQSPDGTFADPKQRYRFLAVLRRRDRTFVAERAGVGFPDGDIDRDAAEVSWLCYAWPSTDTSDDLPTFVLDGTGEIYRPRTHGIAERSQGRPPRTPRSTRRRLPARSGG